MILFWLTCCPSGGRGSGSPTGLSYTEPGCISKLDKSILTMVTQQKKPFGSSDSAALCRTARMTTWSSYLSQQSCTAWVLLLPWTWFLYLWRSINIGSCSSSSRHFFPWVHNWGILYPSIHLSQLGNVTEKWQMEFNPDKFEVIYLKSNSGRHMGYMAGTLGALMCRETEVHVHRSWKWWHRWMGKVKKTLGILAYIGWGIVYIHTCVVMLCLYKTLVRLHSRVLCIAPHYR